MKRIFMIGVMSLCSVFAFSQEMKVSNQRVMVAEPGQKEVPESQNTEGTLIVQPVERVMNAIEQPDPKESEIKPADPSGQVIATPMERTISAKNPGSGAEEQKTTVIKPK